MERADASFQKIRGKKRSSIRERIRRMKKQQQKAPIDEAACCAEWRRGTAGAVSQQGYLSVMLENTSGHLPWSVCHAGYLK